MSGSTSEWTSSWVERDAAIVWHGFTQMATYADNAPSVIERAEGRELIDVHGRRYRWYEAALAPPMAAEILGRAPLTSGCARPPAGCGLRSPRTAIACRSSRAWHRT